MSRACLSLLVASHALMTPAQPPLLYRVHKAQVEFVSEAPLERIEAAARQASGVLDIGERTFAVQIPLRAFEGFNNPLQQEHFNENYVESGVFPYALFQGRIIEACDLRKQATYRVRAKGQFTIHGVRRERIIPCDIVVGREGVRVKSVFDLVLADHDIRVPRVVQQKIAAILLVSVDLLFDASSPSK